MDGDDLGALWGSIVEGVAATQRRLDEEVEAAGFPASYFGVLLHLLLSADHRSAMSAVAKDLSMTTGGFTKLADRMARDGLIDRRSSDRDRRVVHAQLTARGVTTAKRMQRRYDAALRELIEPLVPRRDLATVARTMQMLRAMNAETVPSADVRRDRRPAPSPETARARGARPMYPRVVVDPPAG